MATKKKQTNGKQAETASITIEKSKLAEAGAELETAAVGAALSGVEAVTGGVEEIKAAQDIARIGAGALAAGASDITRGQDAAVVAERLAQLSEVVGVAGVLDVAQGADMLAASEDIETMAAVVGLLGMDDLERGLAVARVSGELATASAVVERMGKPILAAFLADRGEKLQDLAVDVIMRLGAMRALAEGLIESSARIGELGVNEEAEGLVRIAAAEKVAEAGEVLEIAAVELTIQGVEKVVVAAAAGSVAQEALAEGIGDVAGGAYTLGEAAAVDATAQALTAE